MSNVVKMNNYKRKRNIPDIIFVILLVIMIIETICLVNMDRKVTAYDQQVQEMIEEAEQAIKESESIGR